MTLNLSDREDKYLSWLGRIRNYQWPEGLENGMTMTPWRFHQYSVITTLCSGLLWLEISSMKARLLDLIHIARFLCFSLHNTYMYFLKYLTCCLWSQFTHHQSRSGAVQARRLWKYTLTRVVNWGSLWLDHLCISRYRCIGLTPGGQIPWT